MKAEVIQSASPLVTGTYTITGASPSSDMVAAIFGEGIATNNANVSTMHFMQGFTDLRQSISLSISAADATAGAVFSSSLSIVNCLSMINSNGASVVSPIAHFSSAASNGLNLALTTAPGTGRLSNTTLLSGVDFEAECGSAQFASGDTNKAQTYSFLTGAADIFILLTSIEQTGGDNTGTGLCIGYYDGTNYASVSYRCTSGANPTNNVGWASSNSTGEILSATASLAHQTITSTSSSGFTIHLNTNPGVASMVGWMALRGKTASMYAKAFLATLPTSTGNTALVSGMSGAPTVLLANPSRIVTSGAAQNNDTAGCISLGMAATTPLATSTDAANSTTFKYNVATSVAKNMNDGAFALLTQDNTGADVVNATVHSWDSGGVTMNYTSVNASAVYCPGIAFGMPSGTAYAMDGAQGIYSYTGQDASFSTSDTANKYLLCAAGTYNYSLAHATSEVEMSSNPGIYGYTGSNAFLVLAPQDTVFAVDAGIYSIGYQTAQLTVFIPTPPAPGTFPSVIGMILREAEWTLEQAGALVPSSIGYFGTWPVTVLSVQSTATVGTITGPGIVIAQDPIPGSVIRANAPITLTMTELPVGFVYPATNLTSS